MNYKEFLNSKEGLSDRTHLEQAKRKLPRHVYNELWFLAKDAFTEGLKADLPGHQVLNHARKQANLLITKYMNGYRHD